MLIHPTLHTLKTLNLFGMAEALERQLQQPDLQALSFEERLGLLVDSEVAVRDNRRLTRLLRQAKFKVAACIEDIDYRHPRGLKRSQVAPLLTGEWIRAHQNLCLVGPTGSGKTWLACAWGNLAARLGCPVRYMRLPRLFDQLRIAHGDGSYLRLLRAWAKIDLLILDDWGLEPPSATDCKDLLELLDDRYETRSTLITSQLPIDYWHTYLGSNPTVADAILDRLLHNAHKILLKGESMRKPVTALTTTVAAE
jgi:DNA replication protein DnaC